MYILGIDSTTNTLSMALNNGPDTIAEVRNNEGSRHMQNIIKDLDGLLLQSGIKPGDIDLYSVNIGPGDFTGTRIGLSLLKVLSWVEKKEIYGINSLDSIAVKTVVGNMGAQGNNNMVIVDGSLIAPLMDVRKSEIYYAFYAVHFLENQDNIDQYREYPGGITVFNAGCFKILIKRESEYYLSKSSDFVPEFSSALNRLLKDTDTGKSPEYETILSGNAYRNYNDKIDEIINRSHSRSNIFLDAESDFPEAKYLNLCAFYNKSIKKTHEQVNPVYVRDFIPFKGS